MNLRHNIRKILLEFKNNNFLNEDDGVTTTQTTEDPTSLGTETPEVVVTLPGCKDDLALDGSKLRLPYNIKEENIRRANCEYDKNNFRIGQKACTAWQGMGWGNTPFRNYDECFNKYFDVYSKDLCKVGSVQEFKFGDKTYIPCIYWTTTETRNNKSVQVVLPPEQVNVSQYYGFDDSEVYKDVGCNLTGISWVCPEIKNKKKEKSFKTGTPDNVVKDTEKDGQVGSDSGLEPTLTNTSSSSVSDEKGTYFDPDYQISISLTGSGGNK
jgi:hypothetical protein